MKTLLVHCLLLLIMLNARAQYDIVITGNGDVSGSTGWTILQGSNTTSSFSRAPSNFYKFQRTEYLITPSEINTSGFISGSDITSLSFCIDTAGIGTTLGNLKIYLKNTTDAIYTLGTTWTTSGFTMVCDLANWTVPVATGWYTIDFSGGSTFFYNGGGLYIAWEYSTTNTPGTKPCHHRCNITLANSIYNNRSNGAMPTTLTASPYRPATAIGSSSLLDIVGITNIYTKEKCPVPLGSPCGTSVRVQNFSSQPQTFEVTVTVKSNPGGLIRYIQSQVISGLPANSAQSVSLNDWYPVIKEHVDIEAAIIPLPGETFAANNSLTIQAIINDSLFSYSSSCTNTSGSGFQFPGSGIMAAKFHMNGTGLVEGINASIYNHTANIGNTVYAVVMDASGAIQAQSGNFMITSGVPGTVKSFTFPQPVVFSNQDFFIGLAQTTGTVQWYPLSGKAEIPLRENTFFTFPISGGAPVASTANLKYCLEALVSVPAHDVGVVSTDPAQVFPFGTSVPSATLKNFGTSVESFTVLMTIGSYSSTRNVTSLAPGTSLTLTFDTWSHPIAANETLTVCSQLSGDQNPENNCISKAIKVLNLAKTVYGYIVNPGSSGDPVGPVRFSLSNPGNITSLANQGTLAPLYAGTWADGKWYACSGGITGPWSLLTIDPNTGNRTMIGNLGIAINGLSFNTLDSSLYGITGSSLYRINKSNGVTTLMGTFAGVSLSGLAINLSGQAYSIDHVNDVLGTINLITGAFTPVGSLGFSANLDQDIEFDRESGNLYQCSFGAQGTLRYVDQSTGNTMLVGDFDGGALINGFAIPYFITLPIVSAPTATSVTQTALVTGSAIVSTGGANITQKGFCWSVTPNPTLADQHIVAGSGTTSFTSSITGLMPCMTYHVRAFATNSAGISYSEDISFCTICISTDTATNITINGATSGGTITCNGSEDVTARGVCWSVDSLPTVAGSHTTNGAGNGHFSSSLTGLTPGNYYYYRAYLINNDGIFYGNQIRFRVYKLPSIATTPITNTTTTTATSGGSVTVDGYPAITVKGVCYSTLTNPTIADPHTSDGSGSASYISSLNGLLPETGYYVRAYAINAAGTVYGNPQSMKTLPTACLPSVTYGGKTYPTLMIGEKCWLKENLNIGSMISGNITQANNAVIEKYCINNVASNCDIYGGLYQWGEVVQYLNGASNSINWNPSPTGYVQGICPTNWHLPSDAEWTALSTSLGGANVAGGKMKESGTAHWISPNTSASNSSGFTGLPGGFRDSDGSMYDLGYYGYYWSATPNDNLNSWSNILSFNNAKLERYNGIKTNGFAVRCIKNNLPPPATLTITSDTLFSSNSLCYNALQTITVAGNGNKFLVQNGGSATFIAGENIRFLTGTKVLSGGYLRGYIETSGSFCSNQSISKELNVVIESNIEFALFQSYERLLIYPNPTSNNCVLQLPEILSTKEFTIKIFSIYGKQLYSKYYLSEAITEDKIYLSINKLPAGFYLVKLISNSTLLEGNIIKY